MYAHVGVAAWDVVFSDSESELDFGGFVPKASASSARASGAPDTATRQDGAPSQDQASASAVDVGDAATFATQPLAATARNAAEPALDDLPITVPPSVDTSSTLTTATAPALGGADVMYSAEANHTAIATPTDELPAAAAGTALDSGAVAATRTMVTATQSSDEIPSSATSTTDDTTSRTAAEAGHSATIGAAATEAVCAAVADAVLADADVADADQVGVDLTEDGEEDAELAEVACRGMANTGMATSAVSRSDVSDPNMSDAYLVDGDVVDGDVVEGGESISDVVDGDVADGDAVDANVAG